MGITKVCPYRKVPRVCLDTNAQGMCVQGVHVHTSDLRYIYIFYIYI